MDGGEPSRGAFSWTMRAGPQHAAGTRPTARGRAPGRRSSRRSPACAASPATTAASTRLRSSSTASFHGASRAGRGRRADRGQLIAEHRVVGAAEHERDDRRDQHGRIVEVRHRRHLPRAATCSAVRRSRQYAFISRPRRRRRAGRARPSPSFGRRPSRSNVTCTRRRRRPSRSGPTSAASPCARRSSASGSHRPRCAASTNASNRRSAGTRDGLRGGDGEAVGALADGAQPAGPLVADGDRLRVPHRAARSRAARRPSGRSPGAERSAAPHASRRSNHSSQPRPVRSRIAASDVASGALRRVRRPARRRSSTVRAAV